MNSRKSVHIFLATLDSGQSFSERPTETRFMIFWSRKIKPHFLSPQSSFLFGSTRQMSFDVFRRYMCIRTTILRTKMNTKSQHNPDLDFRNKCQSKFLRWTNKSPNLPSNVLPIKDPPIDRNKCISIVLRGVALLWGWRGFALSAYPRGPKQLVTIASFACWVRLWRVGSAAPPLSSATSSCTLSAHS